jgi:hypothetical protein
LKTNNYNGKVLIEAHYLISGSRVLSVCDHGKSFIGSGAEVSWSLSRQQCIIRCSLNFKSPSILSGPSSARMSFRMMINQDTRAEGRYYNSIS